MSIAQIWGWVHARYGLPASSVSWRGDKSSLSFFFPPKPEDAPADETIIDLGRAAAGSQTRCRCSTSSRAALPYTSPASPAGQMHLRLIF